MKTGITLTLLTLISFSAHSADTWTPFYSMEKVQSLASWNGGAIRVEPTTGTNPANCSSTARYDFLYIGGTQESRSAVVTAIYTAFATGKDIRLLIDGSQCSPSGSAIIIGAQLQK